MDVISNELLQEILNYAMLSKTPFCIDDFLDASKRARSNENLNRQSHRNIFVADQRTTSLDDEESTGERPSAITTVGNRECNLETQLDPTQLPNLQDWRLMVGISRRFRDLGKKAFFSHKIVVMDPDTADLLRTTQLKPLSVEDQGMMIKYTTSIIFSERSSQSPSSFLSLPRRIAPFPHLLHIGFIFGYRKKEPLELLIEAVEEGIAAPDHLKSALASIGVPADEIRMTIMACPPGALDIHIANLQRFIYPMIRISAKARERKTQQISD